MKIKLMKGARFIKEVDVSNDFVYNKYAYFNLPTAENPVVEVYKYGGGDTMDEELVGASYFYSFEIINFANVSMLEFCSKVVGMSLSEEDDNYLRELENVLPKRNVAGGKPTAKDGIALKEFVDVKVVNGGSPEPKLDASFIGTIIPAISLRSKVFGVYNFLCANGMYGKASEIISKNKIFIKEQDKIAVEGDNLSDKSMAIAYLSEAWEEFVEYLNLIAPEGAFFAEGDDNYWGFYNKPELEEND